MLRTFLLRWAWHPLTLALPVWLGWQGLWNGMGTLKWDAVTYYMPMRHYICRCLAQGEMPGWNPWIQGGQPFHADPQSGFWYPWAWLTCGLGAYDFTSFHLEVLATLGLAAWGMYRLAFALGQHRPTAWLLGASYPLVGYWLGHAQHTTLLIGAAWLPHALASLHGILFAEVMAVSASLRTVRRLATPILGFALSVWGMLTGGYPALVVVAAYLMGIWSLWRIATIPMAQRWSIAGRLGLAGVLVLVLSAGWLQSQWMALPYYTRSDTVTLEYALRYAFTPAAWHSLWAPLATGALTTRDAFGTDPSMWNGYMGIILLPLLLWVGRPARHNWGWWVVVVLMGLAAMGQHSPVRGWLFQSLPGFGLFGLPGHLRLWMVVGLWAASARGLAILWQQPPPDIRRVFGVLWGLVALGLMGVLVAYGLSSGMGALSDRAADALRFVGHSTTRQALWGVADLTALRALDAWVGLGFLGAALCWVRFGPRAWLLSGALAFSLTDLAFHAHWLQPVTVLETQAGFSLAAGDATVAGLPQGFAPPSLLPPAQLAAQRPAILPFWRNHGLLLAQPGLSPYNPFRLRAWWTPRRDDSLALALDALPIAFLTQHCFPALDHQLVSPPDSLPERWVGLSPAVCASDRSPTLTNDSVLPQIIVAHWGPNHIRLQLDGLPDDSAIASAQLYWVLQQTLYPGWRARLDGQAVPLYPTLGGGMAIMIDRANFQTSHLVWDLDYSPAGVWLLWWCCTGLAALCLLLLGWLWAQKACNASAKGAQRTH